MPGTKFTVLQEERMAMADSPAASGASKTKRTARGQKSVRSLRRAVPKSARLSPYGTPYSLVSGATSAEDHAKQASNSESLGLRFARRPTQLPTKTFDAAFGLNGPSADDKMRLFIAARRAAYMRSFSDQQQLMLTMRLARTPSPQRVQLKAPSPTQMRLRSRRSGMSKRMGGGGSPIYARGSMSAPGAIGGRAIPTGASQVIVGASPVTGASLAGAPPDDSGPAEPRSPSRRILEYAGADPSEEGADDADDAGVGAAVEAPSTPSTFADDEAARRAAAERRAQEAIEQRVQEKAADVQRREEARRQAAARKIEAASRAKLERMKRLQQAERHSAIAEARVAARRDADDPRGESVEEDRVRRTAAATKIEALTRGRIQRRKAMEERAAQPVARSLERLKWASESNAKAESAMAAVLAMAKGEGGEMEDEGSPRLDADL